MGKYKAPPASVVMSTVRVASVPAGSASSSPDLGSVLADAFEHAPYGLLLIDCDGVIVRVNGEVSRLTGHHASAMGGQLIDQFVAPRFHDEAVMCWGSFIQERAHRPMGSMPDIAILHEDSSEIPVEVGVSTIVAEHATYVLLAVQDISERVRLERQLRDANTELEEFTNVASHDLKSPLRGVSDLVEWIAEDLGARAPASVANNLERIRTRVQRMEMLIEELLAYARLGRTAGGYRSIDLTDLVHRALGLVAVPDSFTVTVDADIEPFLGSSTPLETVLRNLVSNAAKHNDRPDGSITIRARAVGELCRIEVIDDGPGVPASAHKRIFRLFQTATTQHADNAGVGLAVCRRLCDTHDASIAVESGPGRGATFVVEWPLVSRRDAIDE